MHSGSPVAGYAVRGGGCVASIGPLLRELGGTIPGPAVVLARLSPPTPVSADVLHAVVDALVEEGCDVTVGMVLGSRDRDRGHRSVSGLARQAGLTGRTPRGRAYSVADLGEDTVPASVPLSSVLAEQPVSRLWSSAGTRVVVGRAVTDLVDAYAACLATLLGAVPEVAGAEPADVATDLLRHLPPTLCVVDSLVTSDGADGGRILTPVATDTVVVATDALGADCAVAGMLGCDRSSSRLVARALEVLGPPTGLVDGDLSPFAGIRLAPPLAREAARRATSDARLARVLSAATGGPDDDAVPVDSVLAALRSIVTPAAQAAVDPVGQVGLVGLLGAVAAVSQTGQAWATGLDKARVDRRVVPLGFDPADHPDSAYDGLPEFFGPFDAVIDALPLPGDPNALRWCVVDRATVFEVRREIAADFDEFVARVDVAEGISLMADYLGGRRVGLGEGTSDAEAGHTAYADGVGPTRFRQAERNLYLPQPNYLAAWDGPPIDVCKIELVERGPDRHRLLWRTIKSPNDSATYDDGTLTFERSLTGEQPGTVVTIRGRQLFTLPPAWSTVDLATFPEVRDPLLEDAYRRFFTTTFDNLEACFEGREFRIGRPPPAPDEPLLTESLELLLGAAGEWLRARREDRDGSPDEVDVHGFRHVRGPR